MNIKYAHKWDTPATLGCSVSEYHLLRTIHLCLNQMVDIVHGLNLSPSTKKKFVLRLEMRKELNPEECHWNDASVGRVVLMMKKKERGHWENIISVLFGTVSNG